MSKTSEELAPKNPYQKFLERPTPMRAIRAFCMQCMGTDNPDDPQKGYQSDIRGCTSLKCPFYNYRPYK